MKYNYFTKVENGYVFNFSLIFWHGLILVTLLGIAVAIGGLLYSLIPPIKREVIKEEYPLKANYPPSVKVAFDELKLQEEVAVQEDQTNHPTAPSVTSSNEDDKDQLAFEEAIQKLRELIPPSKYSWSGKGSWYFPYGERMWLVYNDERYRQWIVQEPGIEDKLNRAYDQLNAITYADRKNLIYGYISAISPAIESKRADILLYMLSGLQDNIVKNVTFCNAMGEVVKNISPRADLSYISYLTNFCKRNSKDGIPLIGYVAKFIQRFNPSQQSLAIQKMINAYYNQFNQNLPFLIESTNLFSELIPQIDTSLQYKALSQYYILYIGKNADRESEIARIENDYKQAIAKIDSDYDNALAQAEIDYVGKKLKRTIIKTTSLSGIGAGILTIVLVATILVFLSIQRSVRKIEERIINMSSESHVTDGGGS